jgi:hypothetical protein
MDHLYPHHHSPGLGQPTAATVGEMRADTLPEGSGTSFLETGSVRHTTARLP